MSNNKQEAIHRTLKRSRIPKGFYLRESLFIGDGNVIGLWTDHKINKGDYIGEYLGKQLTPLEAKSNKSKYMFDVKERGKSVFVLDGKNKKHSSFVRFANSANYASEQNSELKQHDKRIFLRATKTISPHTEILTWYGEDTNEIIKDGYD